MVETYWKRYQQVDYAQIDSAPLHDIDRHFIQLFNQFYKKYTPGWIIQQDFAKRGLHLNLYGDIVISPSMISVFSPRYFGGFKRESLLFYNIQDIAKHSKCSVLSHTFILSDESTVCKIYMAQKADMGIIVRSSAKEDDAEENPDLLTQMFPQLQEKVPTLLSYNDPFVFSEKLCKSLGIIEGGPKYELQMSKNARYTRTERLFDIYSNLAI